MSETTQTIIKDGAAQPTPVPQYYNRGLDKYEVTEGSNGASKIQADDGKITSIGAITDTAAVNSTDSRSVIALLKGILGKLLGTLAVSVGTALPAGTNNIGDVDIASALPAGTNLIGKVGIDQTIDGTTNRVVAKISQTAGENSVVVGSALPAGTNLIGKAGIDQTTDGTTNRVVAKISQTAGENAVTLAGSNLTDAKTPGTGDVGAMQMGFNGATWDRVRVADKIRTANASVAGGGSLTVWTPVAGKKFRLTFLLVTSVTATYLTVYDGAVPIANLRVPANFPLVIPLSGNGRLSATANNALSVSRDAADVTGALTITAMGTEE